jgi:hypothetical protein
MKTLDFTPTWYREALARRAQRRRLVIWLVLIVGALGTWTLTLQARLHGARSDLAALTQMRERQEPMVAQATLEQVELAQALAREARFADLCGGLRLHQVVAELATCLPESAALHRLSIEQDARLTPAEPGPATTTPAGQTPTGAVAVTAVASASSPARPNTMFTGYSVRPTDVGKLVDELAQSGVFGDVQLKFSRPAEANGLAVREFEIQCRLPQFE